MRSQPTSDHVRVAVSSSSQLAADAGATTAAKGGSAVDAAIAAVLVQMTTEPGMVSLAGGAYLAVRPADSNPVAIDGGVEMPGHGLNREQFGLGGEEVSMEYGGGTRTIAGYGSIATPGALAALGLASHRYGSLPWRELVQPAVSIAAAGFPLPSTAHSYLRYSHRAIFGITEDSFETIHDEHGALKPVGDRIIVPGLAGSLRAIAENGPDEFYRGALAGALVDGIVEQGGILTRCDLESYKPKLTPALEFDLGDWSFGSQPPPSIGGVTLGAMTALLERVRWSGWTSEEVERLTRIQAAVLGHRRDKLDTAHDLSAQGKRLLALAADAKGPGFYQSASTVHTSAVDSHGVACAITASSGYGSGVMPARTGIWMNNCLGELELNCKGYHSLRPGERLPSNMAPTVGRKQDGSVLALGSPGADRITTALVQTMLNFAHLDMNLHSAIGAPRLHVEFVEGAPRAACEPGLPIDKVTIPLREFTEPSMFFGGVSGALVDGEGKLTAASDPRRVGGTSVTA